MPTVRQSSREVFLSGYYLTDEEKEFVSKIINVNLSPKVILFFPMNATDCGAIIESLISGFCHQLGPKPACAVGSMVNYFPNQKFASFDSERFPQLKKKNEFYQFINCPRDLEAFLDFAKIADCVITVSTMGLIDLKNLNKTPSDSLNVIDDLGNKAISLLRAQGHLPVISTFIDTPTTDSSKLKDIKFYCKRLMGEEFGEDNKSFFLEKQEDLLKFLLELQNVARPNIQWRSKRGYFLADKVEFICDGTINPATGTNNVTEVLLSGYLKNSWGPENWGHITGYGDFISPKIVGDLEKRNGPQARFVKEAKQIDDSAVYSASPEMAQVTAGETDMNVEEDFKAPDEFADLRNELQKLTVNAPESNFIRHCRAF